MLIKCLLTFSLVVLLVIMSVLVALVMFVIINTVCNRLLAVVKVLDLRCGTGMHKIMTLCAAVLDLQIIVNSAGRTVHLMGLIHILVRVGQKLRKDLLEVLYGHNSIGAVVKVKDVLELDI